MNKKKIAINDARKAIETIAAANNTSIEEIRLQMKIAIKEASLNKNLQSRNFWDTIPYSVNDFSPEEFIVYITNMIQDLHKK